MNDNTDRETRIAAARMRGWDKMQARVLAELEYQRNKPSTLDSLPGYWGQDDPPKSEYEQLVGLCDMLLSWQEIMAEHAEKLLIEVYGDPNERDLTTWSDSALTIGRFVQGYREHKAVSNG
jgi:hypothetical protein